jgi:hypothetical protein
MRVSCFVSNGSPSPYSSLTDLCAINNSGLQEVFNNINPSLTYADGLKNTTQKNCKINEIENLEIIPMRRIKSDMSSA